MRGHGVNKQSKSIKVRNYLALIVGVGVILSGLATGIVPKQAHATDTGYYGEYWNNPTGGGGQSPSFPGGSPVYTHTDPEINFNWGNGSPGGGIQNEDFVARWTRTTYMAAGTYHFSIGSDDGSRVYIDDHIVIDSWIDQGANPALTADYDITAGEHTIKVEYYENGAVAEIYFSYTNQTDLDGDGASNLVEEAGPNSGDANNDGTPDSEQGNVVSYVNSVTGKYAALEVSDTCTILTSSIIPESTNVAADAGFDYPAGLMYYTLNCDTPGFTAQINQYYFQLDASSFVARKYDSNNHSYQAIPGVTQTQVTIDGINTAKVTYQVKDGGSLDEDSTENGTIVDPSGVASIVVKAPNTGLGG
jgi:hypothetical protein